MRKRWVIYGTAAVLALALYLAAPKAAEVFSPAGDMPLTVIVDAGHGGEDGGAVSADGTKESDINLDLAVKTEALLVFLGYDAKMTRERDVSIHDDTAETLRQKKVSDLKNRVALVNGTAGALLLSIHQNSLPQDASVRGAQAFYNAAGQGTAEEIQAALNATVNEKDKEAKPAPKGVYLMENATPPAVLVECGFLSNAEETALLQEETHQKTLACAIAAGLCRST